MTKFRPCIDLHDGLVKQVIGGTFAEDRDKAPIENFVSERKSRHFAEMYRNDNLVGGHVIMLGSGNEESASDAIKEYPQGLQLGGGITPKNAAGWLDRGATHVIVTSYIFEGSFFSDERLSKMVKSVGKDRLVIDLSCRVCSEGDGKLQKIVGKQLLTFRLIMRHLISCLIVVRNFLFMLLMLKESVKG